MAYRRDRDGPSRVDIARVFIVLPVVMLIGALTALYAHQTKPLFMKQLVTDPSCVCPETKS